MANALAAAWAALVLIGIGLGELAVNLHPTVDGQLLNDLRTTPHSAIVGPFRVFTWLGGTLCLDLVFLAGTIALLITRQRLELVFLILASPVWVAAIQVIKAVVDRHRPPPPHLTALSGPSFPSGHTSSSTALYGGLVLIWLHTHQGMSRRARRTLVALAGLLLLLIGWSRAALGVHYPLDVIAGWALGVAWLSAVEARFCARDGDPGEAAPG